MHSRATVVRSRPATTAVLASLLAYALVIGTFLELLPIYPAISLRTSTLLSHGIALVNAATILSLVAGWYWIRNGVIRRHRLAMSTGFSLIMVFLFLYLLRVGGGGTKHFSGPDAVATVYLGLLGIHITLSIVAVPLVLYALVLGLTHTPAELRETKHASVGRVAAGTWLVSLLLGLVTYVLLEHVYGWEYIAAVLPVAW